MQFPASTSQLAQEFWDFSLSLYARPSVAAELLEWQDRRGANVNLALLCIWAGERGRVLSSADIAKAETALAGWSAAVTKPLREIRRRQKAVWRNLAPDPEPARQAVKHAELTAERTEQLILVQTFSPWPEPSAAGAAPVRANLAAYLGGEAIAAPASSIAAIWSSE